MRGGGFGGPSPAEREPEAAGGGAEPLPARVARRSDGSDTRLSATLCPTVQLSPQAVIGV